MGLQTK